jgi:hypothetical protein
LRFLGGPPWLDGRLIGAWSVGGADSIIFMIGCWRKLELLLISDSCWSVDSRWFG